MHKVVKYYRPTNAHTTDKVTSCGKVLRKSVQGRRGKLVGKSCINYNSHFSVKHS